MEYRRFLVISIVSLAIIVLALQVNGLSKAGTINVQDSNEGVQRLTVSGQVEFVVKDSRGNVIQRIAQYNLIVNKGLDFTVSNVFASSPPSTTMQFIALGTSGGTVKAEDTALSAEIPIVQSGSHTTHPHYMRGIAAITPKEPISGDTIGTVKLEKTFAVLNHSERSSTLFEGEVIVGDGNSITIREAGIFDADTGGNMFSRIVLSGAPLTLKHGDTLTITWLIDYDA